MQIEYSDTSSVFAVDFVGFLSGAFGFLVFFLSLGGKRSWLMAVCGAAILVGLIWGIFVKPSA
jgi:membrane protein YdbS with pleckstrin-like domain